jgi:hypothetical protein
MRRGWRVTLKRKRRCKRKMKISEEMAMYNEDADYMPEWFPFKGRLVREL